MKNNKLTFLKIAIVAVLGFATVLGCKKDQQIEPEVKVVQDYQKERRFLSITSSAPLEEVVYDSKNEQFVIYGWLKMNLKDVQELYANANEYKLRYEN